jgi:dienelactone hydrolase
MAKRFLRLILLLIAVLALLVFVSTCTTGPKLAPGVVRQSRVVNCGKERVAVDFYYQAAPSAQPLVVVAHGFLRSKRYMAGWGAELARRGMVAAVLTQPHVAKHSANAAVIARLVEMGRGEGWPVPVKGNGRVALVGFSMGGLTTLLAAANLEEPVNAWVGLDPVDFDGLGKARAAGVNAPGLALMAEPASFNHFGNGVAMAKALGGEVRIMKVTGASHCDPESPTDLLGQMVCGRVDGKRHQQFREHALGFLEATLLGKGDSKIKPSQGVEAVFSRVNP